VKFILFLLIAFSSPQAQVPSPKEVGQAYFVIDHACLLRIEVEPTFAVLFPMKDGAPDFKHEFKVRGNWHFAADDQKMKNGCAHYETLRETN
jgi:hypothetical protein